jgi:hypothetical protein
VALVLSGVAVAGVPVSTRAVGLLGGVGCAAVEKAAAVILGLLHGESSNMPLLSQSTAVCLFLCFFVSLFLCCGLVVPCIRGDPGPARTVSWVKMFEDHSG